MRAPLFTYPLLALSAFAVAACGDESTGPGKVSHEPVLAEPQGVIPFSSPPDGVTTQQSNNNLDVVEHDGRFFFGFRTAPSHFASPDTVLYIVSSDDQESWTLEAKFAMGTDLREPRFLSVGGHLYFYFSVLGKEALKFEPQGVRMSEYEGPGDWSDPVTVFETGFLLWRSKNIDGKAHLLGYKGGENIYEMDGEPLTVHWLTTKDGVTFEPAVPGHEIVETGGGSETDMVILDDGTLIAVTRNEAGDETGWGSKICRAEAGDLGTWKCKSDPKKYDSPLVFRDGDRVFLIGRRNVTETGEYDLHMRDLPPIDQTGKYQIEYSFNPKRCALWEVDPDALAVTHVVDLPSHGDTCFPGLVSHGGGKHTVYNYTSPLDTAEEDWDWIKGQGLPTHIYKIGLTIP